MCETWNVLVSCFSVERVVHGARCRALHCSGDWSGMWRWDAARLKEYTHTHTPAQAPASSKVHVNGLRSEITPTFIHTLRFPHGKRPSFDRTVFHVWCFCVFASRSPMIFFFLPHFTRPRYSFTRRVKLRNAPRLFIKQAIRVQLRVVECWVFPSLRQGALLVEVESRLFLTCWMLSAVLITLADQRWGVCSLVDNVVLQRRR